MLDHVFDRIDPVTPIIQLGSQFISRTLFVTPQESNVIARSQLPEQMAIDTGDLRYTWITANRSSVHRKHVRRTVLRTLHGSREHRGTRHAPVG